MRKVPLARHPVRRTEQKIQAKYNLTGHMICAVFHHKTFAATKLFTVAITGGKEDQNEPNRSNREIC